MVAYQSTPYSVLDTVGETGQRSQHSVFGRGKGET